MKLSISSQGILYCRFTEEELQKHFSMDFEKFENDRDTIERYSDILIRKAIKMGRLEACEGEKYDVTLYKEAEKEYAICIEKAGNAFCGNTVEKISI